MVVEALIGNVKEDRRRRVKDGQDVTHLTIRQGCKYCRSRVARASSLSQDVYFSTGRVQRSYFHSSELKPPRRSASAFIISAGRGGHPPMRTSTGMWRSTGPVTA